MSGQVRECALPLAQNASVCGNEIPVGIGLATKRHEWTQIFLKLFVFIRVFSWLIFVFVQSCLALYFDIIQFPSKRLVPVYPSSRFAGFQGFLPFLPVRARI